MIQSLKNNFNAFTNVLSDLNPITNPKDAFENATKIVKITVVAFVALSALSCRPTAKKVALAGLSIGGGLAVLSLASTTAAFAIMLKILCKRPTEE